MTLKLATLGPWTKGINNSVAAWRIPGGDRKNPGDACRDALNVDFTADGRVVRRRGYSQTVAMDNAHSLRTIGGKTFICQNGELGVITAIAPLTITTLRTGLSNDRISYDERGGEVWWSNGTESGRCSAANTDHPWCLPRPDDIPLVISGVGTLPAGDYRIALTNSTTDGEESPASAIYEFTLSPAGSIIVTLPTAPAGVDDVNVYVTNPNGSQLVRYTTVAAATASVTIAALPQGRRLRDRAFLSPMPAGTAIAFHGGRLLSLSGEYLYYSPPYDYGVYDPASGYIPLGAAGSILASVESGFFVAADRTWFYAGADAASASPVEKLSFGAASGTEFRHPRGRDYAAGWYSDDGVAIGLGDGSVKLLQADAGFIAPTAPTGATWVREVDGQTHVVVSLDDTAAYPSKVSGDFTTARMRYNDDATTMSVNLATGATARYGDWHMTGFATIDGHEYGCNTVGMHLLEGDDDAGVQIQAVLDVGIIGMESQQIKSPTEVYVSGKSSAPLVVVISLPDGTAYEYPARDFGTDQVTTRRHDGMRGLINARQAWFDVVIRNDEGCSMDILLANVNVNHSDRRI